MAENKKVNFKSGLEILMKTNFPSEKLDNSGLKLISELLNDVNSLLIYHIATEYSSVVKVNGQTFQHCARKAIDENFPGDIKSNALSEAYKQLALLESGCIEYGKDATKVKSKEENRENVELKRTEVPIRLFKKGIGNLFSAMFPKFQVEKAAIGPLATYIHEFSKMLAKRASEKAGQKEELQPIDLKNVLPEYFGANALQVALGEANRCLALYEKGLIEFEPKQRNESFVPHNKEVKNILPMDFKPGFKDVLNEIAPGCETDARVKRFLGHILTDIARNVAENASELCQKEKSLELKDADINQSINTIFPRELVKYAKLNGTKNVVAFQSGMISYGKSSLRQYRPKAESTRTKHKIDVQRSTPAKPKQQANAKKSIPKSRKKSPVAVSRKIQKSSLLLKKRKSSKSPKRAPASKKRRSKSPTKDKKPHKETSEKMKYVRSVLTSAQESSPFINVSLTKEAERNLNEILENVCIALIDISVSHATTTKEMEIEGIKGALKELFPPELAKHALLTTFNVIS